MNLSNWSPSIETYPDPFDYDNGNGFVYKVNLEEQFAGSKFEPDAKNNDTLIDIENIDYTGPYNAELTGDKMITSLSVVLAMMLLMVALVMIH